MCVCVPNFGAGAKTTWLAGYRKSDRVLKAWSKGASAAVPFVVYATLAFVQLRNILSWLIHIHNPRSASTSVQFAPKSAAPVHCICFVANTAS